MTKNKAIAEFEKRKIKNIYAQGKDKGLRNKAKAWLRHTAAYGYTYNFTWMGVPIIQFPEDILSLQEIVWTIKPDMIIETGIAHGGSLIFYASMLELIGKGEVLGIDIDIRSHNKKIITEHPMYKRISMIEGSSTDKETVAAVKDRMKGKKKIIVILDSNHSHCHVLEELKIYSRFVSLNSYLVVCDTAIEDMPKNFYKNRPFGKGDNPRTAVKEFLKKNNNFIIDESIGNKTLISVSPDGYLKRIK